MENELHFGSGNEIINTQREASVVFEGNIGIMETPSSPGKSSPVTAQNENTPNIDNLGDDKEAPSKPNDPSLLSWESGSATITPSSRVKVKLLFSNNMAGSIIGRSGQTISDLQKQSSSKIRLSQSGDYFPGSSDRICLIHGNLHRVKEGIALVLGKLYSLQLELTHTQVLNTAEESDETLGINTDSQKNGGHSSFTVRILIPSAACGMLIGREGISIKKLKESSNAISVRLSPKVSDHRTFERILSITGNDLSSCIKFSGAILEGFVRHPEICRYINSTTSYSRSSNISYRNPGHVSSSIEATSNVPRDDLLPSTNQHYHDTDPGVHGIPFKTEINSHSHSFDSKDVNGINSTSTYHSSRSKTISPRYASNDLLDSTMNVPVPDSMIGTILGRRGHTLMELQSESGARIKVSQRDEFVPGTNNRIITISGAEENVAKARVLIRQVISRNT